MGNGLRDLLGRIVDAESVAAAAVVDADGIIISSVPEASDDLEGLAASAAGIHSFLVAMGHESELGQAQQLTVEYSDGVVVMGPVGEDTFLLVVADTGATLGQVRLVIRRYRGEIQQCLESY